MRWMSSLRGNEALQEAVEEVKRVVRAGAGLRVVLHRRRRDVAQHQPLDGPVVEIQLLELRGPEVGLPPDRLVRIDGPPAARPQHREAVVLRGDLDLAGLEVLDRVVRAAVAEGQLVGVEADGAAEQLMAEADAPDGHLADNSPDRLDDVVERGGNAGAV